MKNRYKLITFDLDGTLIDSIEGIAHSYRQACVDFGFPEPPTIEVTNWVGQGHDVAVSCCFKWLKKELEKNLSYFTSLSKEQKELDVEILFSKHILNQREAFKTVHTKYYQAIDPAEASVYPGVLNTLKCLINDGVKLAVLTNKPNFLVSKVLSVHKLDKFFEVVYADGDLPNIKPHPEGLLRLMDRYNISNSKEVLMVGDSENDVKAGLAANCEVLGLTYGYNYGIHISLANPTYVASNFVACLALNRGIALDSSEFQKLVESIES